MSVIPQSAVKAAFRPLEGFGVASNLIHVQSVQAANCSSVQAWSIAEALRSRVHKAE